MKDRIAQAIIRLLPKGIVFRIEQPLRQRLSNLNECFSQNGEDVLLRRIFESKSNGFYVDIGAHHPVRFSNTYSLYLRGWRGINIDAMPGSMKQFDSYRPGDKNLEIGVSGKRQTLPFYVFNEPALNTFSQEEAEKKNGKNGYYIEHRRQIETLPLAEILDLYLPENTVINYLNIDIEGLDMDALRSNNWAKYNPEVISVECSYDRGPIQESDVCVFLGQRGYQLIAVLFNTLIFSRHDSRAYSVVRL